MAILTHVFRIVRCSCICAIYDIHVAVCRYRRCLHSNQELRLKPQNDVPTDSNTNNRVCECMLQPKRGARGTNTATQGQDEACTSQKAEEKTGVKKGQAQAYIDIVTSVIARYRSVFGTLGRADVQSSTSQTAGARGDRKATGKKRWSDAVWTSNETLEGGSKMEVPRPLGLGRHIIEAQQPGYSEVACRNQHMLYLERTRANIINSQTPNASSQLALTLTNKPYVARGWLWLWLWLPQVVR